MGHFTNVSNAFYSADRIGELEVQKAQNYRLFHSGHKIASEKQIKYIEDMKANIEKLGRTDYPKDSNYQITSSRASTYIRHLNKFITDNGLREKIEALKKEE